MFVDAARWGLKELVTLVLYLVVLALVPIDGSGAYAPTPKEVTAIPVLGQDRLLCDQS